MTTPLTLYQHALEHALRAGNATEHTHRPALKTLIESLIPGITATNEPKRSACGAPDYAVTRQGVTVGYIEAKDVGKSLDEAECSDQLTRYRRALDNLMLTDYVEFRWYADGELRQRARLAEAQANGALVSVPDGGRAVADVLHNFCHHAPQGINTPKDLAERLARLTHIIRDIIVTAFETGQPSRLLQGWREAFAKVLIADLNAPERTPDFADMFAQTLAYGLFTARVMAPAPAAFTRHAAQHLIPKSNPFLRDFFIQITGPQLDDEAFASFVDDLVHLLAHTDMAAVLADFGRRTKQEDPVVHFYETFLAAYDPTLRESRGVYYTPEPVVGYIVRSVDYVLKTHFNCPQGLADSQTITIPNPDPGVTLKGKAAPRKTTTCHKVLILDPATGTGTFLYAVIDHIRQQFMQQGNAGLWPGYVKAHLLPRLFGFELLMAPYAVAHFKLSLQLAGRDLPDAVAAQWAYYPEAGERLGVYLTNALQEPHEMTGLPLFTQWVADETNAANAIKQRLPVLVVMGNPPYSYESTNRSEWIRRLILDYYRVDNQPLDERNPKGLQDDYVKFIRFGQWRIGHTENGIVAFITNHGYLHNPTFRGMRQSLLRTFDEIYILDLHGSAKRQETSPDNGKEENVFDIQAGVAVAIFIKTSKRNDDQPGKIYHADLYGLRQTKYEWLSSQSMETTEWVELSPISPFYLFVPQQRDVLDEYEHAWKITDIFRTYSVGISTSRDKITIQWTREDVTEVINDFAALSVEEARKKYDLGHDTRDWKITLAQDDLHQSGLTSSHIVEILYRPFDFRYTYYTGKSRGFQSMPRPEVSQQMLQVENMMLCTNRQVNNQFRHVFVSRRILDGNAVSLASRERTYGFPLLLYSGETTSRQKSLLDIAPWPADEAQGGRVPNLNPAFVQALAQQLGLTFRPHLSESERLSDAEFGPEDIFHYIYAIFHSPTYRARYAEFLKIDFPRVPLTADPALFRSLCALGRRLVGLHLLDPQAVGPLVTRYPVAGDNRIDKGCPRYAPPADGRPGRISINAAQYFEGARPEVWAFYIGGYQPAQKWLKDRRGRQLSYDDLTHYQHMLAALQQTMELMAAIDAAIPAWPLR
jgi:hypothetical protein